MTYRTFTPEWVMGVADFLRPSPADAAAQRELDLETSLLVSWGYGGGRNAGKVIEQCLSVGADLVLFAEFDIRFTMKHVLRIVQAHDFLTKRFGTCAVGAVYPMSSDLLTHVLSIEGRDLMYDARRPEDRRTLRQVVTKAMTAAADDIDRYTSVFQLPFGFTLFPVSVFAKAPPLVEAGGFRVESNGFDQRVCDYLRSTGVKLFADLSLDVGHLAARPWSTIEALSMEV